ncbi:Uncharacterized protein TCM_041504 [Theobroma cacao]|uniref:Uncharacterized protein n=1 Tax=Theobroma cacao TaxID=3641 RepID=A0A061GVW3_THECC|nr:Uncharacterized protein TCM_041504 [Theobroma cacao]
MRNVKSDLDPHDWIWHSTIRSGHREYRSNALVAKFDHKEWQNLTIKSAKSTQHYTDHISNGQSKEKKGK